MKKLEKWCVSVVFIILLVSFMTTTNARTIVTGHNNIGAGLAGPSHIYPYEHDFVNRRDFMWQNYGDWLVLESITSSENVFLEELHYGDHFWWRTNVNPGAGWVSAEGRVLQRAVVIFGHTRGGSSPQGMTVVMPGDTLIHTAYLMHYGYGVVTAGSHENITIKDGDGTVVSDTDLQAWSWHRVTNNITMRYDVGVQVTWVTSVHNWRQPVGILATLNQMPTLLDRFANAEASLETNMTSYTLISEETLVWDWVGTAAVPWTARDSHSNSTVWPFMDDTTSTGGTRSYSIHYNEVMPYTYEYSHSNPDPALRGATFDPQNHTNFCSGEDGWTRHRLDITLDTSHIRGNYFIHSTLNNQLISETAQAIITRTNFGPSISGTNPVILRTSFASTANNNHSSSRLLSPVETINIKQDFVNPTANATYNESTKKWTNTSTDARSGISELHPPRIAFVLGNATPDISEFHDFDSVPDLVPGDYRVWVWARDKAGNEATRRVSTGYKIDGKIDISKTTDVGPTIHTADCVFHLSGTVEVGCESGCSVGAQLLVAERSGLTYQIKITNTDTVDTAMGTFIDYLPIGTKVQILPTWTVTGVAGNVENLNFDLGGIGSGYEGQYRVTGSYSLSRSSSILLDIVCVVSDYETVEAVDGIISNQASLTWVMGSKTGSEDSNYANHKVFAVPAVALTTNWGAAIHAVDCTTPFDIVPAGGCLIDCRAGNPGTVQEGDLISYQIVFDNPSDITQYFATSTGTRNYAAFPSGVDATGQAFTIDLVDAGGVRSNQYTGTVISGSTGTVYSGSWPDSDGNYLSGLAVTGERIYQNTGTMSVAPKSKLIVTVVAKVTGDVGDIFVNQVTTGHAMIGNNSAALALTDANVTTIQSNYTTHQVERGSTLNKWAYSTNGSANNPAIHAATCTNTNSMIILPGCTTGVCTTGTARLQDGNILTYALTMDNSQSSHVARALDGNVPTTAGLSIPGIRMNLNHLDNALPSGLTPDIATLRAYVTDKDGNNITINDGGTTSSAQTVNENGSDISRQVLSLSSGNTNIYNAGNAALLFELQNLNLSLSGSQWTWEVNNTHHHARGSVYDQGSYSITYLFDAEVTTAYDESVPANNIWINQWEQQLPLRVHNPETPASVTAPANALLHSNTTVHMRISEGVDTKFTKVGADNLSTGLSGAEFALYRWDGTNPPTTAQANHMVDPSVLIDTATLPAGQWVRVKANGEDALLTDIFISGSSPLGEIDLGKLQTGTYTLIETKAPSGYTLPVGQWILTIDSDAGDTGASDWKIDFVGKSASIAPPAAIRDESVPNAPTYKIINTEPFLIGLSGLGGTTGMLLTGFVIMAIAGNAYLVRRHKQKKKQEMHTFWQKPKRK